MGAFPTLSETFILHQITGLLDRGHEVEIYASREGDRGPAHPAVERYGLFARVLCPARLSVRDVAVGLARNPSLAMRAVRRYGSLRLARAALPLVGRKPYDVVHAHFGPNGVRASALREIGALRGPLVTTFHGADITKSLRKFGRDLYAGLFRAGELFLPISERWRVRLLELGCDEERVVVHRMGIDCRRFRYVPREKVDGGPVHILSVGRLVEKKGIEYAIRAVARVIGQRPQVQYSIVGDGPLRESLEGLASELGVGEAVQFLGPQTQEQVAELLNRSHLFLGPSVTAADGDQEGIPVVLMEAMGVGLPVVSTLHSGIPELVTDGVSGLLVPERDVDALAGALLQLVDHAELWAGMGAAGRRQVETHYDEERLNDRLVALYEGVAGQERGRTP